MHFPDYVQLPEGEIMCTHMMHLHICLFGDKSKMHPATTPVRACMHTIKPIQNALFYSKKGLRPTYGRSGAGPPSMCMPRSVSGFLALAPLNTWTDAVHQKKNEKIKQPILL